MNTLNLMSDNILNLFLLRYSWKEIVEFKNKILVQ